ncbi:protein LONG AFTER FAR-RED 3 isoform X3 [Rhododendron vialii]|uniref:protein LONG AFTER FAR-RED 3 isoform X3 n=1 Tax=Rhododendron vialii TaxID=182163 RepID=UPI00265DBA93|nr:protein LONG AFTER FAR-RED 3 isoform X3 [Rhododendron vialii]
MNYLIVLSASVAVLLSIALFPLLSTNYFWNLRGPPSFSSSSSSSPSVADLFVTNGFIYTSDSSLPVADSMAIRAGRVLRVGNHSSLQDLVGHGTEVMNLEGKAVVPGFIDSHVHLLFGGLQMVRVELRGMNNKDEFIRKVKDAVRNLKHGSWLLGGGWNNDLWGGEFPMASWIDDITPHNPVWLSRMDGHMGLANSMALKIAAITNNTGDPEGGGIVRTTDGEPTGLLIDSAMKLVLSCIPEVSIDGRREALVRASNHALTKGVTTIVDFGRYFPGTSAEHPWEDFSEVYRWADISGQMKIRVCLFFPMSTWSRLQGLIHEKGRKLSKWLYLGGVKAFADGSLGSNSALFYEIEHAQHLAPGTVGRFGEEGVVASMQPDQLLGDADSAIRKLGAERAQRGSYLFRSLLASNLSFGSDWPVVEINPLSSIKTAMKRIPPGWENAWIPSECISLSDALNAYTISAARACFLDEEVGSLSPGKFADFVVLSTESWDELMAEGSAYVKATYVGGVQAYP